MLRTLSNNYYHFMVLKISQENNILKQNSKIATLGYVVVCKKIKQQ